MAGLWASHQPTSQILLLRAGLSPFTAQTVVVLDMSSSLSLICFSAPGVSTVFSVYTDTTGDLEVDCLNF